MRVQVSAISVQVAGLRAPRSLGLGDFNADIAAVGDLVAKRLKPRFKAGNPHGGRSHVDAAAAGSHVERNAQNVDFAWG